MTVRRRLALLVASEVIAALLVLLTAVFALGSVASHQRFLSDYVFPPLGEIRIAVEDVTELRAMARDPAPDRPAPAMKRLQAFVDRYRALWQVADSSVPLAVRQRQEIEDAGGFALLAEERSAIAAAQASLDHLREEVGASGPPGTAFFLGIEDVEKLRAALARLNDVNFQYMQVSLAKSQQMTRSARSVLVIVGLGGILAATLLGLSVYRSIVPRVEGLVGKIKRFRELGVYEPMSERGGDELSILARALDVSFAAITQRNKEREQFLAAAAHELKTPLTAMKGFARAALMHPDDPKLRDRALAIIDRNGTRLARLSQDLLWLARAQAGDLPFRPGPVDLKALTQRVVGDVEMLAERRPFVLEVQGDAHILADPGLIEHSVFSLLSQSVTLATGVTPVRVAIEGGAMHVLLTIGTDTAQALPEDLDNLLQPFAVLSYEGRKEGLRSTGLSLPLVRRIAMLHGARLQVERTGEHTILFVLEFRR